ncbi:3'(2'),5'-bisphosphate nucleotidase [Pycnococcus provasolii]
MEKVDKTPLTVFDLAIQVAVAAATDIPVLAEESADAVRDNANLLREVTALAAQILSDVNLPPVSEEDAVRLLDDGARETGGVENEEHFILDPIDGTAGLLGGRECAVGLALARMATSCGVRWACR